MSKPYLSDVIQSAKQSDSFWIEQAKLNFALDVHDLMENKGISRSALAGKLGKSAPYVSKVLRGDANVTIETMVKIVRAVEGQIHIKVSDAACEVRWFELLQSQRPKPVRSFSKPWPGAKISFNSTQEKDLGHATQPLAA